MSIFSSVVLVDGSLVEGSFAVTRFFVEHPPERRDVDEVIEVQRRLAAVHESAAALGRHSEPRSGVCFQGKADTHVEAGQPFIDASE
jgi:hypothetical protein